MLALRDGERTAGQLAQIAQLSQAEADSWISLLLDLDYVAAAGGRYRANIPVLAARDRPLVQQLLKVGRDSVDAWLDTNYDKLKSELSDTAAQRAGVPFATCFSLIWHYVFGRATALLVTEGLFADPHDAARKYKGFFPVVFDPKVL